MSSPTRIIDTHQHVFWHGRDDAGLVANLDEQGIEKALLLTWCIHPTEEIAENETVLNPIHTAPDGYHPGLPLSDIVRAKRRYPDRFIVGYCPHVLCEGALDRFVAAINMYDIRACGEWKCRLLLDDPRCIELFRLAGRHSLPVIFHIDVPYPPNAETGQIEYFPQWYGGTVENLEKAMQACPETIFAGHGPGFWREISGDADTVGGLYPKGPVVENGRLFRLMDNYPQLYADLSAGSGVNALNRDTDIGRQFLLKYHQRILFGRDYYNDDLHKFLQTMDLSDEATENIYHKNAERLFRLES